jgi:hypothetical protein
MFESGIGERLSRFSYFPQSLQPEDGIVSRKHPTTYPLQFIFHNCPTVRISGLRTFLILAPVILYKAQPSVLTEVNELSPPQFTELSSKSSLLYIQHSAGYESHKPSELSSTDLTKLPLNESSFMQTQVLIPIRRRS